MNSHKQKILVIESRDHPGLGRAFCSKFERIGFEATFSSDNADKNTSVLPLLENEKFDAILFFLSEVYNLDDSRWQAITFDWSILGWKERSMNAETPLVAIVTMPDQETISRLQEKNVAEIVDWSNKSSAQQIADVVLRQLENTDALVA
jgi:hypothetical protein